MQYTGLKYKKNGRTSEGVDCYGLVALFFKEEYDISLRDYDYTADINVSEEIDLHTWHEIDKSEIRRGDMLILRQFKAPSHVGVAVDSQYFVHCEETLGSARERIHSKRWEHRIVSVHRHHMLTDSQLAHVVTYPSITSGQRKVKVVHSGEILSDIVSRVLTPEESELAHVTVCGNVIPKEVWGTSTVKAGAIITVSVIPEGGGSSILRTALTLGMMMFSGGAGGAFFGNMLQGGGKLLASNMAIGVGVSSMLGMMAINALVPPPSADMDSLAGTDKSEAYSISGTRNRLDKQGVVPDIRGRYKIFPPYATKPYVEIKGDDQWLYCVFIIGLGNIGLASEKIGDTLLSSFSGITEEVGVAPAAMPTIVPDNVSQEALSVELTQEDGPFVQTSEANVDGLSIVISAMSGFAAFNDDGTVVAPSAQFEVKIKPAASGSYANAVGSFISTLKQGTLGRSPTYGLKDIIFSGGDPDTPAVGQVYFGNLGTGPYPFSQVVMENYGQGYKSTPTATVAGISGQLALTMADGIFLSEKSIDPKRWEIPLAVSANGQYDIQITRLTADSTNTKVRDTIHWTMLTNSYYGDLFDVPYDVTWKAIKMKASSVLNGVVDTYNLIATNFDYGRLPSDGFLQALQGIGNSRPEPDSAIDLARIAAWGTLCVNKGYFCDGVFDNTKTVEQRLVDIAASGRARLTTVDGKWSVIIDEAQSTSVGEFTPRNTSGFNMNTSFAELPHGLRCRFNNADNDYQDEDKIVYADGYDSSNATVIQRQDMFLITNWDQVWSIARYILAVARLQPESFTYSVAAQQIRFEEGDRVTIFHDTPQLGLCSGRIVAIGANYIELDETMTLVGTSTYTMAIHKQDGTVEKVALTAGQSGDVKQYGLVVPSGVNLDDLCGVGETITDALVTNIQRSEDLGATITVVPYNEDIYTADSGTIPPYVAPGSSTGQVNPPTALHANEYLYLEEGQVLQGTTLIWEYPIDTIADHYEVEMRRANDISFLPVGSSLTNKIRIPNTPAGSYQFRVRTWTKLQVSDWNTTTALYLNAASTPPDDVINLQRIYRNGISILQWSPVSDLRSIEYVIKFGGSWDGGVVRAAQGHTEFTPSEDGQYFIKARIVGSDIVSENETAITITGLNQATNVIHSVVEDWSGVVEGACYKPPEFLSRRWFGADGELPDEEAGWGTYISGAPPSGPIVEMDSGAIKITGGTSSSGGQYKIATGYDSDDGTLGVSEIDFALPLNAGSTYRDAVSIATNHKEVGTAWLRIYAVNNNLEFWFYGSSVADKIIPNVGRVKITMVVDSSLMEARVSIDDTYSFSKTMTATSGADSPENTTFGMGIFTGNLGYIYNIQAGCSEEGPQDCIKCFNPRQSNVVPFDFSPFSIEDINTTGHYTTDSSNYLDLGHDDTVIITVDKLLFHGQDSRIDLNMVNWLDENDLFFGASSKLTVQPQVSVKPDGGSWGEWQNLINGSYTGREFKHRLEISCQEYITAYISDYEVSYDMVDRVDEGKNISVASGGTNVVYDTPFQEVQRPQITQVSAASGDTVILTSESATGFTVQILDSGGSGKAGTVNWTVRGY